MSYCELVVGGIHNRGHITSCASSLDIDMITTDSEGYHSIFFFGEDFKEHVEKTGSVRGYSGRALIDFFYWDIDNMSDFETGKSDTIEIVRRLESIGFTNDSIRVFFSGNKGFHVFALSSFMKERTLCDNNRDIVKNFCSKVAEGLSSFDDKVYDKTRLIRAANSKHNKTGLFKVEITVDELQSGDRKYFESIAAKERDITPKKHCNSEHVKNFILKNCLSNDTKSRVSNSGLINGISNGFDISQRNSGLTSLAGVLHSRGITDIMIEAILQSVNKNCEEPLRDSDVHTIVESVAKYPVDTDVKGIDISDIITVSQAMERWKKLRDGGTELKSGWPRLDDMIQYFDPGNVLLISARAGIGKTAMGMQMGRNMAMNMGGKTLFASLEMPSTSVFFRTAQITWGEWIATKNAPVLDNKGITQYLKESKDFERAIIDKWDNNLLILDKDSLTLEQVEAYYSMAQESGMDLRYLIIDYLGLLHGTDDYKGLSKVARALKGMAKRLKTRLVVLTQLSRKAEDGRIEPKMSDMRDSGVIEEGADYILGLWLGGQGIVNCKALKVRDAANNSRFSFINNGLYYSDTDYIEPKEPETYDGKIW